MQQQASAQAPIEIIRLQDSYIVKNVWLPYANQFRDVQVTSGLLDDGKRRAPAQWVEYTANKANDGWGLVSSRLFTATLISSYEQSSVDGVDELKELFAADLRHIMMTSTGVTYQPSGLDVVTHDFATPGAQSLEAHLVGPNGYFGDVANGEVSEALSGEKDPARVREVYEWVTGQNPRLFRLNQQPKQDVGRALVLVSFDCFIIIGVDGVSSRPARGWRIAPQGSTG